MSSSLFKELISNPIDMKSWCFLQPSLLDNLDIMSQEHMDDEKSKAKPGQLLKLTSLSKNLLFEIASYLKCSELFALVLTSNKLYRKLTTDPFFRSLASQSYSQFFFQQFVPVSQDFVERVHSIGSQTTGSTNVSSNSVFFTKLNPTNQGVFEKFLGVTKPKHLDYLSANSPVPFAKLAYDQQAQKDLSLISYEQQSLYRSLIEMKKIFVDLYPVELETKYMVSGTSFARELLLDPSECENPTFILPQLTRDSFSKKGLFYRTDKILLQNFSQIFQMPSAQKAKQWLVRTELQLKDLMNSSNARAAIEDVLNSKLQPKEKDMLFGTSNLRFVRDILIYTFSQYKILCQAHALEIMKYQTQLNGHGDFLFIEMYLDKQSHLKALLKKIASNMVVQESFQEFLLENQIIDRALLKDCCFLSDQLLLNLLDQIWIQTIFEPFKDILALSLENQIRRCHTSSEALSDMITKRTSLLKLYKLIKVYELNQGQKLQFATLINESYTFDQNLFSNVDVCFKESISVLLESLFQSTRGFCDFCIEIKHYENFKLMPPEFSQYYYEVKARYLLKAFSKEISLMISETPLQQSSYCADLTLFQIVPQELHQTLFFKIVASFLNQSKPNQKVVNNKTKSCLFMMFHIEGNVMWASKLNSKLMKCHEKIESNMRSNYCAAWESVDEDMLEDALIEQLFLQAAEQVEKFHDFDKEIKFKREMMKIKISREINERLSYLDQSEGMPQIHYANLDSIGPQNSLQLMRS